MLHILYMRVYFEWRQIYILFEDIYISALSVDYYKIVAPADKTAHYTDTSGLKIRWFYKTGLL